jgi:hypothetical protein
MTPTSIKDDLLVAFNTLRTAIIEHKLEDRRVHKK